MKVRVRREQAVEFARGATQRVGARGADGAPQLRVEAWRRARARAGLGRGAGSGSGLGSGSGAARARARARARVRLGFGFAWDLTLTFTLTNPNPNPKPNRCTTASRRAWPTGVHQRRELSRIHVASAPAYEPGSELASG